MGAVVEEAVLGQKRGRVADASHERPLLPRTADEGLNGVDAARRVEPGVASDEQQGGEFLGDVVQRVVGHHGDAAHRAFRGMVGRDGFHLEGVGLVELGAHVRAFPVGEAVEHVDEHGFLRMLHGGSFP